MTNDRKEDCKLTIKLEFKSKHEVEFNAKIPGTGEKFDVICHKKRVLRAPKEYIVFLIFESIDKVQLNIFKKKVQDAADKIQIAFICSCGDQEVQSIPFHEIKLIRENIVPVTIYPCGGS